MHCNLQVQKTLIIQKLTLKSMFCTRRHEGAEITQLKISILRHWTLAYLLKIRLTGKDSTIQYQIISNELT